MNKEGFKLKDQELMLLLILGGVAIFVLVFRFVFVPLNDSNRAMKQEIQTVNAKTMELKQMALNEQEYKDQTEALTKEIEQVFNEVPAGIRNEDKVLEAIQIEQNYTFDINEIAMGEDTVVYALNANGQNQVDNGKVLSVTPMTISAHTSYDGLKNCLRGLKQSGQKMAVNGASFSYDEEAGDLVGTMDIDMYYLVGEGLEYAPQDISDVSTGTSNIFGRVTYGNTASSVEEASTEDDKKSDEESTEEDTKKDSSKKSSKKNSKKK